MICAVVLAAGRSTRMGTQKLLLKVEGQLLIIRVVDELERAEVQEILVVVGAEATAIKQAFVGRSGRFVENADFDSDMLHSVRCGLRALPPECEAVLVVLGDQPGITSELVNALIQTYRERSDIANVGKIIVPIHDGRRGHPLLFSAVFRDQILNDFDGVGLHGLLQAFPEDVVEVAVANHSALEDLDTPEDYERFVKTDSR